MIHFLSLDYQMVDVCSQSENVIQYSKLVLRGHPKIDKTKILLTNGSLMKVKVLQNAPNGSLMKVKSITECSHGAFCNTSDLH